MNSRTRRERMAAQHKYAEKNREVKKTIKKDQNKYYEEMAEKAERAAADGHMRIVHQVTKTISGKQIKPTIQVKDENNKSIFDREGQLNRWKRHFSKLPNRTTTEASPDIPPARTDLPIETGPPSRGEIAKAISQMKSGKAAGPDNISPEALKADIPTTVKILQGLFEKIWREDKIPDE